MQKHLLTTETINGKPYMELNDFPGISFSIENIDIRNIDVKIKLKDNDMSQYYSDEFVACLNKAIFLLFKDYLYSRGLMSENSSTV
jgi:hypothetical protein